jgi:hypothetical protein
MSVFEAIKQAGLVYSSNICLAVDPPSEPALAVTGGVREFAGIRELPVTCLADVGPLGRGSLRPLQLTALSANELINLLDLAYAVGNLVAVIEPISKSPEEDDEEQSPGRFLCGTPSEQGSDAAIESMQRSARRATVAYSGLAVADLAWAACYDCAGAERSF